MHWETRVWRSDKRNGREDRQGESGFISFLPFLRHPDIQSDVWATPPPGSNCFGFSRFELNDVPLPIRAPARSKHHKSH